MASLHDHKSVMVRGTTAGPAAGKGLIREMGVAELEARSVRRAEFMTLHGFWTQRGMSRWMSLLTPESTRPVILLGSFEPTTDLLIGAIVAVWNETPSTRFDELIEVPGRQNPAARPGKGVWHIISVTTLEELRGAGLGMGRMLLGRMHALLASMGHAHVCALAPVFGLPELMRRWHGTVEDAVLHSAREDGRPVLQVMRLHLGGGARLERVLHESRRDDEASAHLSLRFGYATDSKARAQQKERWLRWIACRAERLSLVTDEFDSQPLYRANPSHDPLVWDGFVSG